MYQLGKVYHQQGCQITKQCFQVVGIVRNFNFNWLKKDFDLTERRVLGLETIYIVLQFISMFLKTRNSMELFLKISDQ